MAMVPENRMEQILAGENVTPECRTEYFAKEAIDNAGSGGGGSSLPKPGTAGNVLTSTGTDWESAPAPDGGEFVVDLASDGQGVYTATHDGEPISVADVAAAAAANKSVVVRVGSDNKKIIPLIYYSDGQVYFSNVIHYNDSGVNHIVFAQGATGVSGDEWAYSDEDVINEPLFAEIEMTSESGGTVSVDCEDIKDAFDDDRIVVFKLHGVYSQFYCMEASLYNSVYTFHCVGIADGEFIGIDVVSTGIATVTLVPKQIASDYLVEFTPDPQGATGSEMIATHGGSACTVADVVDAYEAGKTVKGKVSISDSGTTVVVLAPLTSITQNATGKCVVFGAVREDMSSAAWTTKTAAVIGYNDTSATSGNDIWAAVEG